MTTVTERGAPATIVIDGPATESKTAETRESSDGRTTMTVTKTNDAGDRKTVRGERCA